MVSSAVLRVVPFLPVILYFAVGLVFATRPDSDTLRMVLCCVGSFCIYFYIGWVLALLFGVPPVTRLAVSLGLPTALFLLLAGLDMAAPSTPSSGGFISFDFTYKMLWTLPGMFLSRFWWR